MQSKQTYPLCGQLVFLSENGKCGVWSFRAARCPPEPVLLEGAVRFSLRSAQTCLFLTAVVRGPAKGGSLDIGPQPLSLVE